VTDAHQDIAATYLPSGQSLASAQRAQVIAQFDQVRAEVPDFFVVNTQSLNPAQSFPPGGTPNANYPLNFGGLPYPLSNSDYANYVLPLSKGLVFVPGTGYVPPPQAPIPLQDARRPGTGIFGASYTAASGIYKNLGYAPQGYDGVDNNGNGFVDEVAESGLTIAQIAEKLQNHQHKTARSEMLYALLVEGQGPLGSVFNREDFTEQEVQDTDGDGLPEFIDAWGEPLRFYRWPLLYSPSNVGDAGSPTGAYTQKGPSPYDSTEARQVDQLDPAQTLMAPSWWWSQVNGNPPNTVRFSSVGFQGAGRVSAGAVAFMSYFHTLLDPLPDWTNGTPAIGTAWDRSSFLQRRSYYSRPLILSGGPDKVPGLAELDTDYKELVEASLPLGGSYDGSGTPAIPPSPAAASQIENLAAQIDPRLFLFPPGAGTFLGTGLRYGLYRDQPNNQTSLFLQASGQDDISNQGLASPGGGVR
jgi:hypothetical protein